MARFGIKIDPIFYVRPICSIFYSSRNHCLMVLVVEKNREQINYRAVTNTKEGGCCISRFYAHKNSTNRKQDKKPNTSNLRTLPKVAYLNGSI